MAYYYSDQFLIKTFNKLISKYPTKLLNGFASSHLKQYMGVDANNKIYSSLKDYPNYVFTDHSLLIIQPSEILNKELFYIHFKECSFHQQEYRSLFKRQIRSFISRPLGQFTVTIEIPTDHYEIFKDIFKTFLSTLDSSGIENATSFIRSVSANYPTGFEDNLVSFLEKNKKNISFDKQSVRDEYDKYFTSGCSIIEKINIKNNKQFILDQINTDNFLFHIDDFVFLISEDRKSIIFRLMQYYKSLGENIEGDIINLSETYNTKLKEYFGKIENKCLKDLFKVVEQSNTREIEKIKSLEKSSPDTMSENISNLEKGNEFDMLLKKHEKEILNIDSKYILCFVRLNSYLKSKKSSLKKINDLINTISSIKEFKSTFEQINKQFKSLEQMEIFSVLMITSLLDQKMIVFYTIYEKFDQIGVFESNWERELLKSLENINENIISVVDSINRLEINMRISLMELGTSIVSQISDSSSSVDKRLASIGSDLKFNNLLTAINTYKLFNM